MTQKLLSSDEEALSAIKEAVLKPTSISSNKICGIGDYSHELISSQKVQCQNDSPLSSINISVRGYDFNKGINYSEVFKTYLTTGFQATNFGLAVEQIELMVTREIERESNKIILR